MRRVAAAVGARRPAVGALAIAGAVWGAIIFAIRLLNPSGESTVLNTASIPHRPQNVCFEKVLAQES
jgi:hypothetical protein